MNLDSYLGVHSQALLLAARRNELLANNLANADTPNFKARDLDFRAALASASGRGAAGAATGAPGSAGVAAPLPLAITRGTHLQVAGAGADGAPAADLKYRVPLAPSLDGNTVDVQLEQSAFAENSVRYQTALSLLNGKFRALMTAITGQ